MTAGRKPIEVSLILPDGSIYKTEISTGTQKINDELFTFYILLKYFGENININ